MIMKKALLFFLLSLLPFLNLIGQRINEFHYDNIGGDVGEFVEVFIPDPQPANIGNYDLRVMNGNGTTRVLLDFNNSDLTMSCSGTDAAGITGVFYQFSLSLQNDTEGFLLEDDMNNILQFISYEGIITATSPMSISGATSTDIGLAESNTTTPIGASIEFDPNTNTWIIQDNDTPCAQNALPVELISFNAAKRDEGILLLWATATEIDNDYFQVEHSTNGIKFDMVEKIQGAGTSISIKEYNFIHENPSSSANYYRLKQVDFDGAFEYSKVVSLFFKGEDEWFLHPTLTGNQLTVQWSENIQPEAISIFSLTGKMVFDKKINIENSLEEIDVQHLPKGNYFLKLKSGRSISTKRFLKI